MKLPKNPESGQTLVMALILLAVGALLVVPLLSQVFTIAKYNQSIECKTLNSFSADSGIEYVRFKLYNQPGVYTETPLQDSLNLNGRTVDVAAEYQGGGIYKVTSTARGGSCGSTTITSYVNVSTGAFAYTVAAKEGMTLQNTTVDSLPDPNEGHIHSNANIELSGCIISGSASAVGTISGKEQVNGLVTEGSPAVQFPADFSELYEDMAKEGGTYLGNYTITEGPVFVGPLYIKGNLRIENATVMLEGTVYITGNVSVENGNLDGDETVCAEGSISIEQGEVRSDVIPIFISLKVDGEIYSEWETTVDGVLYAPYGRIRLENGVDLYGATAGKTVTTENCTITYAKELYGRQDLPGAELATVSYSYD